MTPNPTSIMTRSKNILFAYEWTIGPVSDTRDKNFITEKFEVEVSNKVAWYCLEACPMGFDHKYKTNDYNYLIIYLHQLAGNIDSDKVKLKISILNNYGREIRSKTEKLESRTPCIFQNDSKYINNYSNGIIIYCEIYTLEDNEVQYKSDNYTIPECTLPSDFGHLFEDEKYYDFTISVGDQEYRVHKAVLAARSLVFEAMFKNEMEEKKTNKVIIQDLDQAVLKEMLRYIYTGSANISEDIVINLLDAANKYALERLKQLCAQFLYTNMSVENAAKIFTVAYFYDIGQLRNSAKKFIIFNAKDVINTSGWDLMSSAHPNLLKEAFAAVAKFCD